MELEHLAFAAVAEQKISEHIAVAAFSILESAKSSSTLTLIETMMDSPMPYAKGVVEQQQQQQQWQARF